MGSLKGKTFIYDLRFFNGWESTYLPTRSYSYSLLLELLLVTSSWRQEYGYELDLRCVDQKKRIKPTASNYLMMISGSPATTSSPMAKSPKGNTQLKTENS